MMKKIVFLLILIIMLSGNVFHAAAQSTNDPPAVSTTLDTTGFPQWVKDMRRWDIIAFGSFPFTFFFTTFFMDMVRWGNANNFDFGDMRYAPWPLKSAGAIDMTKREFETTLLIAVSLSVVIAFTDLFIVQSKRNKERRRIESMPRGSTIIITPYQDSQETDSIMDYHLPP
jgi:hypothetical protein